MRFWRRSVPWVRAVATRRPRPALASHAEKASRIIGAVVKLVESSCRVHRERAMKSDSIMPSKHKRADRRWWRWRAKPVRPRVNAAEKAK